MHKFIICLLLGQRFCNARYLEGVIKTNEKWTFLTRFCFLSEEGQFEYFLEFNEEQGRPNLLLYYDTDDQWPAVYKTGKTCQEMESVLHPDQNQIINLTVRQPYLRELSGCAYKSTTPPTVKPNKYTVSVPTIPTKFTRRTVTTPTTVDVTTPTTVDVTTDTTLVTEALSTGTEPITMIVKRELGPPSYQPPIRNNNGVSYRKRDVVCHNARRFRSSRERWWFIALSNCDSGHGIHVKYRILMTNGLPGDYWHEHFSADEFYILPVLMAFSIAYSFLMLGVIMCSIELKSRQLLHTTYKIFVMSTIVQLFGIIFTSAAYLRYAVNGVGPSKVRRFGSILMGLSETLFLLLLLLLAKGYTITRGRLPLKASIKLTVFMCLYSMTYVTIFIYEANVFDPGLVLYLYESPAGYGLITLRILAWCMFIYSTIFTLKHYPEKSNFYYPFNVCGTLWFVAGPAFVISANTYIDKWVRESVVCAVLQFITFGGHLSFLVLTMPSVANKNFPYHVRTTQIGVMELTGGAAIEQFNHHVYEPSGGPGTNGGVIVPLTRRTEQIFEGMYNQPKNHVTDLVEGGVTMYTHNPPAVLENVMSWSTAKNVDALRVPEVRSRSSFSMSGPSSIDSEAPPTRRASLVFNGVDGGLVREVPLELFTISKVTVAASPGGKSK